MGINTGEAIERHGDYFGPAVIKAARLMSLVGGRRIVCSRGTAVLVEPHLADGIRLLPVGTVRLKGLGGAEEVFAIAGTGLVAAPSDRDRRNASVRRAATVHRSAARQHLIQGCACELLLFAAICMHSLDHDPRRSR